MLPSIIKEGVTSVQLTHLENSFSQDKTPRGAESKVQFPKGLKFQHEGSYATINYKKGGNLSPMSKGNTSNFTRNHVSFTGAEESLFNTSVVERRYNRIKDQKSPDQLLMQDFQKKMKIQSI